MSSIRATGSGQREYGINGGSGQYTSVSLQPKGGDDLSLQIGSVGKIEFAVSPNCLRIERRVPADKEAGYEDGTIIVVIESPSATAINLQCRNREQNDLTPSVTLRVQDTLEESHIDALEARETVVVGDLFPGVTA